MTFEGQKFALLSNEVIALHVNTFEYIINSKQSTSIDQMRMTMEENRKSCDFKFKQFCHKKTFIS